MALLGNYSVLHKSPMRFRAGSTTSVEPQLRSNFGKSGAARNFFLASDTTNALDTAAIPTGYYPPYTWVIPIRAGEIGSNVNLVGSGIAIVPLAGGKNAEATINGVGDCGSPILLGVAQVLASLLGSGGLNNPTAQLLAVCIANVVGSASVSSANLTSLVGIIANLSGGGLITAAQLDGLAVVLAYADLTGGGQVTQAIANARASLQGSLGGSASLNSPIIPGAPIVATFGGSSTMTTPVTGLGWLVDTISAGGTLTSTIKALGELDSVILSYSQMTPEGIRDVVWNGLASKYTDPTTMGGKLNTASSGGVDFNALANAVWTATSRSLTTAGTTVPGEVADAVRTNLANELTRIIELATINGLVLSQPAVVTATTRSAGTISQTISEVGGTITVERS